MWAKVYLDGKLVTEGREPIMESEINTNKVQETEEGWEIDYGDGLVMEAKRLIK